MSLSRSQLALFIKDLECKNANLTAEKYTKSLKYGTSCIDCLHRKITFARGAISVLKRFFADGKDCENDCNIVNSWVVSHICGYINSPFTSYICYYTYGVSGSQPLVNSLWQFGEDLSVNATDQDGNEEQGTYVIDGTTITVSGSTNFTGAATIEYSEDCSSMIWTYDNPNNAQTIIIYFENTTTQSDSCDWNEHCLTEEEAVDLYKNVSSIIGKRCSCG